MGWASGRATAPDSVDHLAVLSVGHPVTFLRTLEQREKSWYMLLFNFPGAAERWLTGQDWAGFRAWARHPDSDQVIADLEATGSYPIRRDRRPEAHGARLVRMRPRALRGGCRCRPLAGSADGRVR